MLKRLKLQHFTVFPEADLQFAPGLNVIVGENGCGKTHLLKVAYCLHSAGMADPRKATSNAAPEPTKAHLQRAYADKLVNVFRPEELGRLASRIQGRKRCQINVQYTAAALNAAISFATSSKTEAQVDDAPRDWQEKSPVYLPTRELLTIYPNFVAVYENHYLELEETWRDTCVLLGGALVRGARERKVGALLEPLESALAGKVVLESNGRFYLSLPGQGRMEMPLVAEGLRKFAMLARLIANGKLLDKGTLFWDEPEANLNPKLIKIVARVILDLSLQGIQIIIATHSLFLLREIEIAAHSEKFKKLPKRFFALRREDNAVIVEQGDDPAELQTLVLLDEELAQSDRYLALDGVA